MLEGFALTHNPRIVLGEVLYTNQDPTSRMNPILQLKKYVILYLKQGLREHVSKIHQNTTSRSRPFPLQCHSVGSSDVVRSPSSDSRWIGLGWSFHGDTNKDFLIKVPRQTVTSFHAMLWSLRLDELIMNVKQDETRWKISVCVLGWGNKSLRHVGCDWCHSTESRKENEWVAIK